MKIQFFTALANLSKTSPPFIIIFFLHTFQARKKAPQFSQIVKDTSSLPKCDYSCGCDCEGATGVEMAVLQRQQIPQSKTTLPGSHPCLNRIPSEEPSEVLSTGMEYIIIFKMNNLNSIFFFFLS